MHFIAMMIKTSNSDIDICVVVCCPHQGIIVYCCLILIVHIYSNLFLENLFYLYIFVQHI